MEVIAQTWCERESQNFGLFKRVNDLHEELEFLNDQLFDLRSEITIEQDLEDSREEHRRTTLEKLEAELEQVTNESQESQKNLEDMNIYINSMLKGIDELFKICKCNGDPIYQLLGHDDKSITVYNVMLYIQMIERAIHTALIAVYNNEKLEVRTVATVVGCVEYTFCFSMKKRRLLLPKDTSGTTPPKEKSVLGRNPTFRLRVHC